MSRVSLPLELSGREECRVRVLRLSWIHGHAATNTGQYVVDRLGPDIIAERPLCPRIF